MLLFEEVQKFNRENAQKSGHKTTTGYLDLEAGVSPKSQQPDSPACNLVENLREDSQTDMGEKHKAVSEEEEPQLDVQDVVKEEEKLPEEKKEEEASDDQELPEANGDEKENTRYI